MRSASQSGVEVRGTTRPKLSDALFDSIHPYSFKAFLLAVAFIAIGSAVRAAFGVLGTNLPFTAYFPGVLIAALVAGIPAGIFATVGAVLITWWAYFPSAYAFTNWADTALFTLSSGVIIALAHCYRELLHRHRERERQLWLIMDELEHRDRNTYAVIEAIIKKTLEDDPNRAETIAGRVRAVKYTNDLINRTDSHAVLLRSLFLHEFAPYDETRVEMDGDDIDLPPDAARHLALVFHELATNAAKYGSLSRAHGRVLLRWQKDEERVILRRHTSLPRQMAKNST